MATRKQRGIEQSIFLIETVIDDTKHNERKYIVMGSTGNVYDVVIKNKPECSCPDYMTRGNRCKHLYFILIRVMKAKCVDKKRYSDEDLVTMFNNIPPITNNLVVGQNKKEKYKKLKGNDGKIITVDIRGTDDLCPICLDDLQDGNKLDYCKYSCGKPIHELCFQMWCKKKDATCVFCRRPWFPVDNGKYINLL